MHPRCFPGPSRVPGQAARAAATVLALVLSVPGFDRAAVAQTDPGFKIAFWNVQGGNGQAPLPGRTCSFVQCQNCTDGSQPLNAWGMHVVQDELIRMGSDPGIVALGLAEAWGCATPSAIRQVLGWKGVSSARSGIGIVARFGFAGAEEWVQLDTTNNENPADTKFVLRVPVCLDQSCTRSVMTYTTHLYGAALLQVDEYANYAAQAAQLVDFTARASGTNPHLVTGDFNVFEGTSIVCTQPPKNEAIRLLRAAGYVDAWPAVHGTADGSTGMWNRPLCGLPEGNLWKRIDYSWSKRVNPLALSRFGMVTPGECAPSDHAGIIVEYVIDDPALPAPGVSITAPAANATVHGVVQVSAQATDAAGIRRVEWLVDGRVAAVQNSGSFTFSWDTRNGPNGVHVLRAAATNLAGRRTESAPLAVTVANPSGPGDEIVLYAADAGIKGTVWTVLNDATAAEGQRLQSSNAGATVSTALAAPASYAELTFDANANIAYRLWIRGKAAGNSPDSDSVHVQFSGAVNATGTAVFRIGTQSSTRVALEDCTGCGLSNWGWQDNAVGRDVLGPLIYFALSGPQKLRIQVLEDGLGIDQVLLSSVAFRFGAPGALGDDQTILPPSGVPVNLPPSVQLTAPAPGTTLTAPASVALSASASDSDDGVARVEFLANGAVIGQDASAPYTLTWSSVPAGQYTLAARATDTRGAGTTSPGAGLTVLAGPAGADEIVVHVGAGAAQVLGGWTPVSDATAASGVRLQNPDAGTPKLAMALASPGQAFEVSFTAEAGTPYRLWLRGRALGDKYGNDSVYVQFSGSVSASGTPMWRIGTTSATPVILEDSSGAGLSGWGWADNTYTAGTLGPVVYFATSGTQRLRVQMREDGLGIDQIVLSAVRYFTTRPGATRNDTTILAPTVGVSYSSAMAEGGSSGGP